MDIEQTQAAFPLFFSFSLCTPICRAEQPIRVISLTTGSSVHSTRLTAPKNAGKVWLAQTAATLHMNTVADHQPGVLMLVFKVWRFVQQLHLFLSFFCLSHSLEAQSESLLLRKDPDTANPTFPAAGDRCFELSVETREWAMTFTTPSCYAGNHKCHAPVTAQRPSGKQQLNSLFGSACLSVYFVLGQCSLLGPYLRACVS